MTVGKTIELVSGSEKIKPHLRKWLEEETPPIA